MIILRPKNVRKKFCLQDASFSRKSSLEICQVHAYRGNFQRSSKFIESETKPQTEELYSTFLTYFYTVGYGRL